LFQPHIDLEKTSGGGPPTEQTTSSSQVNGLSQSQDSEPAGFEAITAEEPFRGYSFEVCLSWLPPSPVSFVADVSRREFPRLQSRVTELTNFHTLFLPNLGANVGTTMLCLRK
jgi:hypothetical protein